MLVIGSDHGGFELKEFLAGCLREQAIEFIDVGCFSSASVDYPEIAKAACEKIVSGEAELGILVCGTGIGMSMAANKIKGIRAACCSDTFSARLTREHNDANVLCLGGRVVGKGLALELLKSFLGASFQGGRHERRVAMLTELED